MKLIVFDLDFTLWNAGGTWCDHTCPPYTRRNGSIVDSNYSQITLYPDVRIVLEELFKNEITMAIASRTGRPDWAEELLQLFEIGHFFKYKEIYPSSKIKHFQKLHRNSGIPFEDMVFFDDEMRNISEVSGLGVDAVYVEDGIHEELVWERLN